MASQLWGPTTVIVVFTVAGGLIGGDIALGPFDGQVSIVLAVATGLVAGGLGGAFIAWFVRQIEELN